MSTVQRRRGQSLHLELPNGSADMRPPIAALFLIRFDVKAGYTIAWKQCIPGLKLADSVEFKSLPSGLHNVEEDLVYFMHDNNHAGISAFINRSALKWDRNAMMLAVGALVPLENGRLGKSWKHAEYLKALAEQLVLDPTETHLLEEYWDTNHITKQEHRSPSPDSRLSSSRDGSQRRQSQRSPYPQDRRRSRAISSASGIGIVGQGLSARHPALSLSAILDTFGPLIYPLYKTALLRKRILFVTQAPVELACNFVYDISILSAIPSPLLSALPLEPLPTRLDPLFSIGIHDIDTLIQRQQSSFLSKDSREAADLSYGWVACTTDDVLIQKKTLYDILVMLPAHHSSRAVEKAWPTLRTAEGSELKATQRDLRRYRTLRQCLKRAAGPRSRGTSPYTAGRQSTDELADDDQYEDETDQTPLLAIENTHETYDDASSTTDEKLIEPSSWSELAYSSFMWWASAGEKRGDRDDEAAHDAALFRDFAEYSGSGSARPNSRRRSIVSAGGADTGEEGNGAKEMAVIAYFHRLTTLILGTLVEVIEGVGWREEDGDPREDGGTEREGLVVVGSEDMSRMGLDVWSEGDRNFVVDLVDFYWGRKAEIGGGRVECCGVRIY